MGQPMLNNTLTLNSKEFVKTTFSSAGTFYRDKVLDSDSLVVRFQRTKKGQSRTNLTSKVVTSFTLPSGASAETPVTVGITIANFDVNPEVDIEKAIAIAITALQTPDFIKQVRRGEQ